MALLMLKKAVQTDNSLIVQPTLRVANNDVPNAWNVIKHWPKLRFQTTVYKDTTIVRMVNNVSNLICSKATVERMENCPHTRRSKIDT
jgi:hypothetical protein